MVNLKDKELIRSVFNCWLHATFASIYIYTYLVERLSEQRYESHGFTGHLTFGGRYKFATMLGLV